MKLEDKGFNGIYRGIVVSNKDPLELGRVQVRIPFLHGTYSTENTSRCIADDKLPYALPCSPFASHDAGMLLVPEVGSMVFILFENGDNSKPVYIGQMFSKGCNRVDYYGYTDSEAYKTSDSKRLKRAGFDDTPKNSYKNGVFRLFTLFKSPKGTTIEIDDSDNNEHLSIFDRLGQSFVMYSPTTHNYSRYGVNNRGIFSTIKSKFQSILELPAIILMKTINQSYLRFVSKNNESITDLVTVYEDKQAGVHVSIGKDNRVLVFNGDSKFEIKDDSIIASCNNYNIKADNIRLCADTIYTTSSIKVEDFKLNDVDGYTNNEAESNIE